MKLLQGIRTVLLAGFLTVAGATGALAEYTSWQDTEYDFSQVKTVYLSEMDLSGYGLESGTKAQKMLQEYRKKAGKVKSPKVVMEPAAQLYILALLDKCQVDSYLVPAHTEWKTREIDDSYRDDKGNWHTFYRTITYPEYIPDYYVPYASVTVRFLWFDTKTGKLVASSEDARVRNSENDPLGVYNRIIDRFFKNLKEMGRK